MTRDDLQLLLKELESVQDPEHEVYEGWIGDETREKWLVHICSVHQLLSTHMPVAEKQYNQDAKRKKDETRKSA